MTEADIGAFWNRTGRPGSAGSVALQECVDRGRPLSRDHLLTQEHVFGQQRTDEFQDANIDVFDGKLTRSTPSVVARVKYADSVEGGGPAALPDPGPDHVAIIKIIPTSRALER